MEQTPSLAKSVWRTIYPPLSRVPLVQRALQWRNALLHRRSDPHTVSTYLSSCREAGLHLGCGPHVLAGWLNTDLHAIRPDVVCVDVTKRFPFGDSLFDYVFTEHMIEHLCFADARNAITESFRVLKPGGRIRVSTPDLARNFSLKAARYRRLPVMDLLRCPPA
jgi:SAM-dependent methyltransferase